MHKRLLTRLALYLITSQIFPAQNTNSKSLAFISCLEGRVVVWGHHHSWDQSTRQETLADARLQLFLDYLPFVGCATLSFLCLSTQSSSERALLESSQPNLFKRNLLRSLQLCTFLHRSAQTCLCLNEVCLYGSREHHRALSAFWLPPCCPERATTWTRTPQRLCPLASLNGPQLQGLPRAGGTFRFHPSRYFWKSKQYRNAWEAEFITGYALKPDFVYFPLIFTKAGSIHLWGSK